MAKHFQCSKQSIESRMYYIFHGNIYSLQEFTVKALRLQEIERFKRSIHISSERKNSRR